LEEKSETCDRQEFPNPLSGYSFSDGLSLQAVVGVVIDAGVGGKAL